MISTNYNTGSYEYTTPSYSRSPAPTPYSLFQSVPENIQEHDVFNLSQNVDFGKKLGKPSGRYNEVDTGRRSQANSLNIDN